MKLVFATGIFPPDIGGPATYVDGLARELHRRGDHVEVVTYGTEASEPAPFFVRRVNRSRSLPHRYWAFFLAVRRSLGNGAVVAYLQDPVSAGLPATLAAISKKRPTVVKVVGDLAWEIAREQGISEVGIESFQSTRHGGTVGLLQKAERFVARRAARVITPSRYLKGLVSGWGVEPDSIEVIENSISPRGPLPARDEARRELELSGNPILLSAGRLVPWKGFDTLLRSLPAIQARRPEARLYIAGSGPCEASLESQIEEAGLRDAVELVGSLDRDTMARYLRASDVFVLASTYEGFSHVLLEAMLAGTPVVASRAGGNPELVEDGETGLLVAPDPDAVAGAIVRLAENRGLWQKLASRGERHAGSFSWEKMVARTSELLQEVTASKSRR